MNDPLIHLLFDVGHANGTGAKGNGLDEHELNARLATLLRDLLPKNRFLVSIVDFPESCNSADLNLTVAAANAIRPAFVISLHCDSAKRLAGYDAKGAAIWEPDPTPHGAHVCYYSRTGERMARAITRYLCALLPGRAEQVVRRTNLAILTRTNAPAVLVESGFLPNEGDATILRCRLAEVAEAIAQGIVDYFNNLA